MLMFKYGAWQIFGLLVRKLLNKIKKENWKVIFTCPACCITSSEILLAFCASEKVQFIKKTDQQWKTTEIAFEKPESWKYDF